MKNILGVLILLFLFSCGAKEIKQIDTQILKSIHAFDEFEGSIFFTGVEFESDENQIYIVNKNPSMLIILGKDFRVKSLIERKGNGPGDLGYPNQILLTNKEIMIEDLENLKVSIVDPRNGNFINEILIPEPISRGKFCFDGKNTFFFPVRGYESDSTSILKVNLSGEMVGKIGSLMPQKENDLNRQSRIIQTFDDKLLLIGVNLPFIDIVNNDGELIKRHTLDQFEPIKRALDSLENDFQKPGYERNPKEVKSIVIDAQFTNNKLYLTFTDRIGLDRSKARHLLEFSVNESSIDLTRIFRFQTDSPDDNLHPYSFHVDEHAGKIYTQGLITKQIYVFDLPK